MLEYTKFSQVLVNADEEGCATLIGKDQRELEFYTNRKKGEYTFAELKDIQQLVYNRVENLAYGRKILLDAEKTFLATLEWLENN